MLGAWGPETDEEGVASITCVLQGICSLRSLSCLVKIYPKVPLQIFLCTSQPVVWQWHAGMACNAKECISAARAAPCAMAPTIAGLDEWCQAEYLYTIISYTRWCLVQATDTALDFPQPQLASLDTLNLMFVDFDEEPDYQVSSARLLQLQATFCTATLSLKLSTFTSTHRHEAFRRLCPL